MILSKEEAAKIINLNPSGNIDKGIADRQFKVILKGFNYLYQEESDFLYISDEVGLGKTYIALGIAALLRHFAPFERRDSYKEMVLVPKRNLQYKWIKEVNNFIKTNYILNCNIVKSVLGRPVASCKETNIHNYLDLFPSEGPSFEVYRNSSFSITTLDDNRWISDLEKRLSLEKHIEILRKGVEVKLGEVQIKRLFSYLLSLEFPKVDFLIVDEAHHYKHGIEGDVSHRNQVVSRLMGVIQDEDNSTIFKHFPELKVELEKRGPTVKKLILLSATPIDNGLFEIKNQLDCFLPNHQFKNIEDVNRAIEESLTSFMIRGLMKIKLKNELNNNGEVSRNMYRHEHRNGNVEKSIDATPQKLDNDLEAIILGLIQFKTLKHLNESNNKSFEIGMLAGFETFNTQSNSEKEYEETSTRNQRESEDQNLIKDLATSFFDEFQSHIPHPKQDRLIEVLVKAVKENKKSLVFVRRIASVVEIERKLLHQIELWQNDKLKKYVSKSKALKALEKAFGERHQIVEIEKVFRYLADRIAWKFSSEDLVSEERCFSIEDVLSTLYHSEEESEDLITYRSLVLNQIGKKNYKESFKELAAKLVSYFLETALNYKEDLEDLGSETEEESHNYFFSSYFGSKRYKEGFQFRNRASRRDWYRFNIYQLKEFISDLNFSDHKIDNIQFLENQKTDAQKRDRVNDVLIESITVNKQENLNLDEIVLERTFFNVLFEEVFKNEFAKWVKQKWEGLEQEVFFIELFSLIDIFQGIFRNGSGLLPAFIAESLDKENFGNTLIKVLKDSFPNVIEELRTILVDYDKIMSTNFSNRSRIQRTLYGQQPIIGVSGAHKRDVSKTATQFRMPGFPYVLITTDVLKEGEDLHLYCKDVYHYGVAWNPSDMEQRTGRIDRINSNCYFDLIKEGKRTFENSLQVFYPYLADTLEVNQVAKVFNKMNDFVETFYDISAERDKDTRVSTDTIVKNIPPQIKDFLTSKYDYQNFKGINYLEHETSLKPYQIGCSKDELIEALSQIKGQIRENFTEFIIEPKVSETQFSLFANINLEGRSAPLRIKLIKGRGLEDFCLSIESIICKSPLIRERSKRLEIKNGLQEKGLNLVEDHDFLLVRKIIAGIQLKEGHLKLVETILQSADEVEEKYTQGDLNDFN